MHSIFGILHKFHKPTYYKKARKRRKELQQRKKSITFVIATNGYTEKYPNRRLTSVTKDRLL